MSIKYRVRLEDQRIIGPILEKELIDLVDSNQVNDRCEIQIFPIGSWKKASLYSEFTQHFEKKKSNEKTGTISKVDFEKFETKTKLTDLDVVEEFKYGKNKVTIDYTELEKKYSEAQHDDTEIDLDKTRVVKIPKNSLPSNQDKTVVKPVKINIKDFIESNSLKN